ncbi:MAG: 3D domain-containing protein [Nitrospiria bacterium]
MDPEVLNALAREMQSRIIYGDLYKKPGMAASLPVQPHESNVEGDLYDVTFYCGCPICCGKNSPAAGGHGLTASGKPPKEGLTIASDWSILPKGSLVDIEGFGQRKVMDTGSAIKGKRIDIFMEDHEEAKKAGRKKLRVKKLE